MTSNVKPHPLPFNETLRDLALLRASDIDFSSILPPSNASEETSDADKDVDATLQRSYEFVKEARAALKILNRGDVDTQGARVEDVRSRLEDMLQGLDSARSQHKP
ncbi:unnamed protein product [Somion occarium]